MEAKGSIKGAFSNHEMRKFENKSSQLVSHIIRQVPGLHELSLRARKYNHTTCERCTCLPASSITSPILLYHKLGIQSKNKMKKGYYKLKKIENPKTSIKIFSFQTCLKNKPQKNELGEPYLNVNYRYSLFYPLLNTALLSITEGNWSGTTCFSTAPLLL